MLADASPGTETQLLKEVTTGYVGFDPTAESLHIGSLVPILLLMHMQKAGHKPLALIGGATGMVGDPSGKSTERNLLGKEELNCNVEGIRNQLKRFLDFDESNSLAARLVNNYDWFQNISFLDFLRDTGKHITINYMMSKESVRKRIEGENGISYTEFAYQLLQGFDFVHLYREYDCKLQFGGSDQWGNMTTGTELIRRKTGGEAFVFTCPLITKADGTKFGKTESGNVWLDAGRTSPYQFYQFWLNSSDADAEKWISIFTFLSREEIEGLKEVHKIHPEQRILQKKLAAEVTILVHGEDLLKQALETTEQLFSEAQKALEDMSEAELLSLQGIVQANLSSAIFGTATDGVTLLAGTGICSSRGEARKLILNGGISINRKKLSSPDEKIEVTALLHHRYLLVQKGKKNHFLVSITGS